MVKFLLLVAIAAVIYFWLSAAAARRRAAKSAADPSQETMVTCAHCGVHLPASDSVSADAHVYCSDEHRVAGPK